MGTDVVYVQPAALSDLAAPTAERTEEARFFQASSLAPATIVSYRRHVAQWVDYCRARGLVPMPADPVHVANWLSERATSGARGGRRHGSGSGQALGTLQLAFTALLVAHKDMGCAFQDPGGIVRRTLRGIQRVGGADQEQVKALRGDIIVSVIERLDLADPMACRDAALLSLGYMFARRRSELVALDWKRRGAGDGHIDIDAHQATVVLARHKTAMKERALTIIVPRDQNRAAFAAVERWIKVAQIAPETPVLRRVRKNGSIGTCPLASGSVPGIIKRRIFEHLVADGVPADVATEESEMYSGHSLRHGFATTSAENGADLAAIAKVTKHRGVKELRRYIEQADALKMTAHTIPGVGLKGRSG